MISNRGLVPVLAQLLLSGPWMPKALERRAIKIFGPRSQKRAKRLAAEILASVKTPYAPQARHLERLIADCKSLKGISDAIAEKIAGQSVVVAPPRFAPLPVFHNSILPVLTTTTDLARWLDVPPPQIEWFAEPIAHCRRPTATGFNTTHIIGFQSEAAHGASSKRQSRASKRSNSAYFATFSITYSRTTPPSRSSKEDRVPLRPRAMPAKM